MKRINKGDEVIVTTGRSKGTRGHVLQVLKDKRLLVENVNMVKRHTRPTQTSAGGIVEKEASIHVSNLAQVDPKDDKATRTGVKVLKDGRKVRYAKRSGEVIDK